MTSTKVARLATIHHYQGIAFQGVIEIVDSETGAAIDITSWEVRGGVRQPGATAFDAVYNCSVYDGPTGQLQIKMTSTEAAKLSLGPGIVDLLFLGDAGVPLPLAQGETETELYGSW